MRDDPACFAQGLPVRGGIQFSRSPEHPKGSIFEYRIAQDGAGLERGFSHG
jgi:hypothetical protein